MEGTNKKIKTMKRKAYDYRKMEFFELKLLSIYETIVVAATHNTLYQSDAGGIKASSRWLSEATASGYEMGVKAAGTPAGVQDLMSRFRPVVSSLTLLNHRLLAAMPPASF